MKKMIIVLIVTLIISACNMQVTPSGEEEIQTDVLTEEPQGDISTGDAEMTFTPVDANKTSTSQATNELSLTISGTEEVVFDWTTDHCEEEHIPDIAARAIRDEEGRVQLLIGHYVNYRMIGPDLNNLSSDCTLLMRSDYDPDPSLFNDSEWLAAPYTEDGRTIYAIMHNEYRGDTHKSARPAQCPSNERLTCLDTSVTMSISTDGGDSYKDILEPPNHMVATLPYVFNDQGVPSGLRQPSNIIRGKDGYFYVFTNISDYPPDPSQFPPQWVCVMRTQDISDPASWRFWDGEGFTGRFINPYIETVEADIPKCAPLEEQDLSGSLNESVTYNTTLGRYIMMGYSLDPILGESVWGIFYSLSDDLIHWTQRKLLIEIPGQNAVENPDITLHYAYPSMIDPDSTSMSFETTDSDFYLYITRYNGNYHLDRDLIRFPVTVTPPVYSIPSSWHFDSNDTDGWVLENQLTSSKVADGILSMESTGDDPYMISGPINVPAGDYNKIGIRMRVSSGTPTIGQLFFVTDADSDWSEEKSLVFNVNGDGEYHDYILDMSTVNSWAGAITQMRLDPVASRDRTIEIDIIAFIE